MISSCCVSASEIYRWCVNAINCTGKNMSDGLLHALGEADANLYLCSKDLRPSEKRLPTIVCSLRDFWVSCLVCVHQQQQQPPFYGHYTDQLALACFRLKNWGDFVGAKFYCPHALADGNQRVRIREKTLHDFSTALSTLYPYFTCIYIHQCSNYYWHCPHALLSRVWLITMTF